MIDTSLRTAFEQLAEKYAAEPGQKHATHQLEVLQAAVAEFQAEGFDVSLQVRPGFAGCGARFPGNNASQLGTFYANGTLSAAGVPLEFAIGKMPGDQDIKMLVTWEGRPVMLRRSVYSETMDLWRDRPEDALLLDSGFDRIMRRRIASGDLKTAVSALVLDVLAKNSLVARFSNENVTLDKPAHLPAPSGTKKENTPRAP